MAGTSSSAFQMPRRRQRATSVCEGRGRALEVLRREAEGASTCGPSAPPHPQGPSLWLSAQGPGAPCGRAVPLPPRGRAHVQPRGADPWIWWSCAVCLSMGPTFGACAVLCRALRGNGGAALDAVCGGGGGGGSLGRCGAAQLEWKGREMAGDGRRCSAQPQGLPSTGAVPATVRARCS